MATRVLLRMLAIGLILSGAWGCAFTKPALPPAVDPAALASPQYAVIRRAQLASLVRDWPAFSECVTPRSYQAALREHLLACTAPKAAPDDSWYELFAKHGITRERLSELQALTDAQERATAVAETVQQVADPHAYSIDFLVMLEQSPQVANNRRGSFPGVPIKLIEEGSQATVILDHDRGEREVLLENVDGEWKIDLPNG